MERTMTTTILKTARCAVLLILFAAHVQLRAQAVIASDKSVGSRREFTLSNAQISYTLTLDSGKIVSDKIVAQDSWAKQYGNTPTAVETDANFGMQIMWTDWQAPDRVNNADNPVEFNKGIFQLEKAEFVDTAGGKELTLYCKSDDVPLRLKLSYLLTPKAFYIHRNIGLCDSAGIGHFVQFYSPFAGTVSGTPSTVVKDGGFGQPVALRYGTVGVFFGVEYPAADQTVSAKAGGELVTCRQEMGEKIGKNWLESNWDVEGITPNGDMKLWFMNYVNDLRVAPLRPYTLYNSWYDLRSPTYPKVPAGNVMNEKNVFHIIDLIRQNMIEKNNIQLDAFVLDDGWDVYQSDWVLNKDQFPNGLKPISDELKKTHTDLGMWFGPTGGYSYRMKRINWMKDHGYETVGKGTDNTMMCLAGTKYSDLFRKRTTDFVAKDGLGFFKWDGIQFSCSEPDHGHPTGIFSRRAVMESVIDKCRSVRAINPNTFLNITSGTWLSPWWVQYANQIWMQGEDYGYADVPSISPRDAAITYRDLSLYDDFTTNNFWFPIQNLMTHGIIKGNLEKLGGEEEPLDKFTNEAMLYFARGVSMWELYISPDILTEDEWTAMAQAIHWAKDRFPILSSSGTEMIGGDPKKRETYGYAHFKGFSGIIAARNPWIESSKLSVTLAVAGGLDPVAKNLVLEKVYPDKWISPKLYAAGDKIDIPLDGYETAMYEVYPLDSAEKPLIAGVRYDITTGKETSSQYALYSSGSDLKLLNPSSVLSAIANGKKSKVEDLSSSIPVQNDPVDMKKSYVTSASGSSTMTAAIALDSLVKEGTLAMLFVPADAAKKLPQVRVTISGKTDTAAFTRGDGKSTWYTYKLGPGLSSAKIEAVSRDSGSAWSGHVSVWTICRQQQQSLSLNIESVKEADDAPMPPRPLPVGERIKNIKLAEIEINPAN
jgi:hypothetical protein